MTEYTPTTEQVREVWAAWSEYGGLTDRTSATPPWEGRMEEFDRWLAEVVREASEKAENERDCLRFELDGFRRVAAKDNEFLIGERDAALSTIAKVRELHCEYDHECVECSFEPMPEVDFRGVSVPWPCRTIQALGSVPSTEEGNDAVQGS